MQRLTHVYFKDFAQSARFDLLISETDPSQSEAFGVFTKDFFLEMVFSFQQLVNADLIVHKTGFFIDFGAFEEGFRGLFFHSNIQ